MEPLATPASQAPAGTPPTHPADSTPAAGTATRPTREGGPPPLVPALAFGVLTVAAAVLGAGVPRPAATAAEVLTYDTAHPTAINVAAALLLGSTLPLVISAVTLYRRLRRLRRPLRPAPGRDRRARPDPGPIAQGAGLGRARHRRPAPTPRAPPPLSKRNPHADLPALAHGQDRSDVRP